MSLHISHPSGYSARYYVTPRGPKNEWVWYVEYRDPEGGYVTEGALVTKRGRVLRKDKDSNKDAEKIVRADLENYARNRAGGKARHAPERSRLRPFATYCASCHKHISGSEHAWKVAGDKYLCNACGSATGGKKRHGQSVRGPMPEVEWDGRWYKVKSRKLVVPDLKAMDRIDALLWLNTYTWPRGYSRPNPLAGYAGVISVVGGGKKRHAPKQPSVDSLAADVKKMLRR